MTWSEFFQKVSFNLQGPSQKKNDRTVLFQVCQGQVLVSMKGSGLDTWKKSLFQKRPVTVISFFQILEA